MQVWAFFAALARRKKSRSEPLVSKDLKLFAVFPQLPLSFSSSQ